ncbi:MAG TPA: lipopolysaccharide biosynthesis protein [Vicinamibacterales bacterium]
MTRQGLVGSRLRSLFSNLAIYGAGDVATSLVSLLLLPVYTRFLTPVDYGIIAMLLTIEALAKIVFRWGVDTAFLRLYYDCPDDATRQKLASTILFFLLAANGSLVLLGVACAGWFSTLLFGTGEHGVLITLVLVNTFVGAFYFIPFQVLRIRERSGEFIALVFSRTASTLVLRLVFVIGAGLGVAGLVWADIVVTAVFTPILGYRVRGLLRPVFSRDFLRGALAYGLPRIPHSVAGQVIGFADRYFLNAFGSLRDVGLFSIGASFGLAPKLFLSALQTAWTPFFLSLMHEPDARRMYSAISTYLFAMPVLLVAVLSAAAPDLVRLTTTAEFHDAAAVTPWIALGVLCQGINLIGSIGLVITKRTALYPIATGSAAAVSLAANALLVPRHGAMGAAWANAIANAALAGITVVFSWHVYPIRYEWGRLVRIGAAGIAAYGAGAWLAPATGPLAGVFVRSALATGAYGALLLVTGFFKPGEIRMLRDLRERALGRRQGATPGAKEDRSVEMAGEILSGGPELPDDESAGSTHGAGAGGTGPGEEPAAVPPAPGQRTRTGLHGRIGQ